MAADCGTSATRLEVVAVAGKGTADARVSIRVPGEVVKRADALRAKIARDRSVAMLGKVTSSTVFKLALLRGLEALEAEYR